MKIPQKVVDERVNLSSLCKIFQQSNKTQLKIL